MATTYDLAWVTKFRYDVLTSGNSGVVPGLRNYVASILVPWGASVIGQVKITDDLVHTRINIPETKSVKEILKYLKGQMSLKLQNDFPDLKSNYSGKQMWGKTFFKDTGNPGDAAVDTWKNKHSKHTKRV